MSIFSKKTNNEQKNPTEFLFELADTSKETSMLPANKTTQQPSVSTQAKADQKEPNLLKTKKETSGSPFSSSKINDQSSLNHTITEKPLIDRRQGSLFTIEKALELFNSLPPVDVTIATSLIKQTLQTVGVDLGKVIIEAREKLSSAEKESTHLQNEIYTLELKLAKLKERLDHTDNNKENIKRILFLLTQSASIDKIQQISTHSAQNLFTESFSHPSDTTSILFGEDDKKTNTP